MARKGRYMKKPKLGPGCQQPKMALPPTLGFHHDDSQIPPESGESVPATSRPFIPPRSEPRPAPQASTNSIQNSEPGHIYLASSANDVDSLDQEVDDPFVDSRAQSRKGRKTTEFWTVKIIDSDGTIKPAKLSVREAMERLNGRRIVLKFNNNKQPIRDETGLLSGVLGLLGSEYEKFPIYRESWHKITTMEDEAVAERKKMKAMESALIYLFQRQGEELPPDIAVGMSFVE